MKWWHYALAIGGIGALYYISRPTQSIDKAKTIAESRGYNWDIVGPGASDYISQGYTPEEAVNKAINDLKGVNAVISVEVVN